MVRRFGDASVLNRRLLEIGSCGLVFGSEVFALEFYSRILSLGILFQSGFQPSSFRWLVALFELKVSGHKLPIGKNFKKNYSGPEQIGFLVSKCASFMYLSPLPA